MSKNNITGDNLVSKPTQGYQDGWNLIWLKKETDEYESKQEWEDTIKQERYVIHDDEKVTND